MAEVVGNGLPLGQAAVLQVRVDFALTLVLKRGEDAFEVRIEQPFEFVAADGGVHALDPEGDPVRLGPVLACARTVVAGATVFEDGRLEVGFADGSVIRVPVSEEYEGWNLVGPDGLRVVAGPGGKVTNWSGVG
ncbi:DUF6188 family protein [Actinoplanes sp. NPDC051343]|uniref:DUF6188 family protein n=1 Tax=Actinoplanes sp. NPDC051343 TaxID=3363906 RepID=UPI0037906580